ncbi:MAG: type IX secretion system membrane protein PorP/SprF [Bacteroidota bacterium]|nr:type IX secretion system membrane protein PorP/SprF [Bacteroidota bacterium]
MKTFKKIIAIAVLVVGASSIYAQQDPMFTHYMYNTLAVNPAYAGSRDALTITGLHRSQWLDFKGAPQSQTLTVHSPLKNEHIGLGLSVLNDKIGPTNNTSAYADFAYRIKLNEKSKLALGMSGGAKFFQANLNTLNLDQTTDPTFQNNISNRITPNFGFGAYYSRERFYAGVSVPNLLQNSYSEINQTGGSTLIAKEQRHYFFIAGTVIKLTENLALKPTTLIKVTEAAPIQADLTASFLIGKKLLLGAMYRSGDAAGVLVGFDIIEQLHIGYSFDWSYGLSTARYNKGSHEVMLRYDFISAQKKQIHSPRYF